MSEFDFANVKGTSEEVPLSLIRENQAALRTVDKTDPKYLTLLDSIKSRGLLNPIVVRKLLDPDTQRFYFGLIDGLHRFTCAQDAGLPTVPVRVVTADDAEALELQIIGNVQKVETKPAEYSKGLQRLMGQNPFMTLNELAGKVNKSPAWVGQRLSLLKLHDPIGKLVDDGKIGLSNAYVLAKLPPEEQPAYLDRAMSMNPKEFAPTVDTRVKEIKEARREGRKVKEAEFQPVAFLQKLLDVSSEMDKPTIGPYLCSELGLTTAESGFAVAVKWFLHLDPKSIEAQQAKDEQRRSEDAKDKEERARSRKEKKTASMKEAYERAQHELETAAV